MQKKYSAFTLVEMLIVMGIVVLLMAIGIVAARAIMNNANDTAHQGAIKQINTALVEYSLEKGYYPTATSGCIGGDCTPKALLTNSGPLEEFIGSFDGGTNTTFYYFSDGPSAMICVARGGVDDAEERGLLCEGDGIMNLPSTTTPARNKEIEVTDAVYPIIKNGSKSNWMSGSWNQNIFTPVDPGDVTPIDIDDPETNPGGPVIPPVAPS